MAFAATAATEPRSFSVGPLKAQLLNFSVASADVAGTATADRLSSIQFVIVSGVDLTAAPTFSSNVITLAFADPAATRHGQIIAFGV